MSTDRKFNELLNEYLYHELLMAEFVKRSYFMQKIKKDDGWKGGPLPLRFESSMATSMRYGGLTEESEIDSFTYLRSVIPAPKEVWGSMVWEGRDIREHDGKGSLKVQTILKNLPDQIDRFIDYMKQTVTMNLLNGNFLTKFSAPGTTTGEITLQNIERIELGQKLVFRTPDGSSTAPAYVSQIDINSNKALMTAARNVTTPVDLSGFPRGTTVHVDGAELADQAFTSIIEQLDASVDRFFSLSKSRAPFLQAVNIDAQAPGLSMNVDNILDVLFNCITRAKQIGKGNPTHLLMSYKHLGAIKRQLEKGSGAYRHVSTNVSPFNYEEVTIGGVKGSMVCVGLNEKDSDTIIGVDWRSIVFHTNEGFKKEVSPDGLSYYTVRKPSGYRYICDIACFGEFVVTHPCHNFLIKNADFEDPGLDATILRSQGVFTQTGTAPNINLGGITTPDGSPVLNAVRSFLGTEK